MQTVQSVRACAVLDGDYILGALSGKPHRVSRVEVRGSTVRIEREKMLNPLTLPAEQIVRIIPEPINLDRI